MTRFLEASKASEDRYFAAWMFLATTGCRRGEVLGLRWSDLDLDAMRARIVQTVTVVGHQVRTGAPKTAKGRRSLSLDPVTVAELRTWRRRHLEERMLIGDDY